MASMVHGLCAPAASMTLPLLQRYSSSLWQCGSWTERFDVDIRLGRCLCTSHRRLQSVVDSSADSGCSG